MYLEDMSLILWAFVHGHSFVSSSSPKMTMSPDDVSHILQEMNLGVSRTAAILRNIGMSFKNVGKIIRSLVIHKFSKSTTTPLSIIEKEDSILTEYALYLKNLKLHDQNVEGFTFVLGELFSDLNARQQIDMLVNGVRLKNFSHYALVYRNLGLRRCPIKLADVANRLLQQHSFARPFSSVSSSPHSYIQSVASFIRNIEFHSTRDEAMFLVKLISEGQGNFGVKEGDNQQSSILLAILQHMTLLESKRVALIIKEICHITSARPFRQNF
jgi:hypothetical protein